jgi:PhnB protein
MSIQTYLAYNGDCAEAFKFYETALGGKIDMMMTHGEAPPDPGYESPPEWRDKIMHASIVIAGDTIMGSDSPPGRYEKPAGFSLSVSASSVADAERVFAALTEGGTVTMKLQQTFWAVRFGMGVDRFGIPWMVNCEAPEGAH